MAVGQATHTPVVLFFPPTGASQATVGLALLVEPTLSLHLSSISNLSSQVDDHNDTVSLYLCRLAFLNLSHVV